MLLPLLQNSVLAGVNVAGVDPAAASLGIIPGSAFNINLRSGTDIDLSLVEVELEGQKVDQASGFLDFYNTVDGSGSVDRKDIQCVARQAWAIDLSGTVDLEVWYNSSSIYTATFTAATAGEMELFPDSCDGLLTIIGPEINLGSFDGLFSFFDAFVTAFGDVDFDWIPIGIEPSSFDGIWKAAKIFQGGVEGSAVYGKLNWSPVEATAILFGTKSHPVPASAVLQAFAHFAHEGSAVHGIPFLSPHPGSAVLGKPHSSPVEGAAIMAAVNDDCIIEILVIDPGVKSFWESFGVIFLDKGPV